MPGATSSDSVRPMARVSRVALRRAMLAGAYAGRHGLPAATNPYEDARDAVNAALREAWLAGFEAAGGVRRS